MINGNNGYVYMTQFLKENKPSSYDFQRKQTLVCYCQNKLIMAGNDMSQDSPLRCFVDEFPRGSWDGYGGKC